MAEWIGGAPDSALLEALRLGTMITITSGYGTKYRLDVACLIGANVKLAPDPWQSLIGPPAKPIYILADDEVLDSFSTWLHMTHPWLDNDPNLAPKAFLLDRLPHLVDLYLFANRYSVKDLRNAIVRSFWDQVVVSRQVRLGKTLLRVVGTALVTLWDRDLRLYNVILAWLLREVSLMSEIELFRLMEVVPTQVATDIITFFVRRGSSEINDGHGLRWWLEE